MGVGGHCHSQAALSPERRLVTHCTGCWVGPRVGLDGCGKSCLPLGFNSQTVQPTANSHTDYPILACLFKVEYHFNPYPTAFPYGNGMVLHFYQQQESSTTKTVHKVINKGLKTYV